MTRPSEYHWVLQNYEHIEFPNGGDPVPAAPTQNLAPFEGLASISDSSGSLVMYTDGASIWDGSLTNNSLIASNVSGNSNYVRSAIIVPPAGTGGTDYHVFSADHDRITLPGATPILGKIVHSTYRPNAGTVSQIIPPNTITSDIIRPNYDNTERLAATSHAECDKYWMIFQDGQNAELHAVLVDSNAAPTTVVSSPSSLQQSDFWGEHGEMRFSPDGKMMAYTDLSSSHVVLFAFDNMTGVFTDMHIISDALFCHGLEFSPDSKKIYVSSLGMQDIRAHVIANGPQSYSALPVIVSNNYVLSMQLAPNDKIYCKPAVGSNLIEIGQPNTPLSPAIVQNALYADGTVITLSQSYTLPIFTRISDSCAQSQSSCKSCVFPWTSGSILEPHNFDYPNFSNPEVLTQTLSLANSVGTDGMAYNGLTPWHRKAELMELSVLKLPLPAGYIGSANLDIVVLDYSGVVLRTISTTTINLVTLVDYSWTSINLSTVIGDLYISSGEIVAGQLTMDTTNSV